MAKQYNDWLTQRARRLVQKPHPANGHKKPEMKRPTTSYRIVKAYNDDFYQGSYSFGLFGEAEINPEPIREVMVIRGRHLTKKQRLQEKRRLKKLAQAEFEVNHDAFEQLLQPRD